MAISTAIGWMKRVDETGSVARGQMGWKTITFLAALRHDRIDAPWFIEGPIMA
ncbi:transposase [Bradyrhizobium sp. USDA 3650]